MNKNKKGMSDMLRYFVIITVVVVVLFVLLMIATLGGCDQMMAKM
jgi:preprotein translocase subunit SecE